MLHENAITWELIAESSKAESPAVHAMVLKRFDELDAVATTSNTNTTVMHATYLSYPAHELHELCTTVKLPHLLKTYPLDLSDDAQALLARCTSCKKEKKKKDKKHKSKKHGGAHDNTCIATVQPVPELSKRERIRQQQTKALAQQAADCFAKSTRTTLRSDFTSQVVEVVVLYYLFVTHYSFREKAIGTFIDALFSMRDALACFRAQLHPALASAATALVDHLATLFPWKSFLQHYTHLLIRTHFKKRFQKAMKPFAEQDALIRAVHAQPHALYVMPWGVGTGKTAMLPPLSTFYQRKGYQTLYCVPFGPVRDQSAALLYRCGIPFAYVVRATSGAVPEAWELQPSFHCSDGKDPQVLIVDPAFVKAYTLYWEAFAQLVNDPTAVLSPEDNPPDVRLPNRKRRYAHLSHRLWNPYYALLLDEPCEEDDDVRWVLHHLPDTAFVMSATSWELVDDTVRDQYARATGNPCTTIAANTIGVSTTLVGYWLDGEPVLSPFHGVRTRAEFAEKLAFVRDKVLWKRFLSAQVLLDWATRVRRVVAADVRLSVKFDVHTLTFDAICARVLDYCDTFLNTPTLDDTFFATFFAFGNRKPDTGAHPLHTLLTHESAKRMGGCIIGTPTVKATYKTLAPLLEGFPSLDEMQKRIDEHRKDIVRQYADVNKMPVTKKDDLLRKQQKCREIESKKCTSLPIPDELVINTPEYLKHHNQQPPPTIAGATTPYLRVQELLERGDPVKGLDDWQLRPDTMEGSFWRYYSDALQWRWKGVGSILDHKEFNMKNIADLERGYVGFLLLDKLGAQGLNLKIRHGVLMRGEDGSMLPVSTCLQVAGRVGRWGQDGTGYVYLADEEVFLRVFG